MIKVQKKYITIALATYAAIYFGVIKDSLYLSSADTMIQNISKSSVNIAELSFVGSSSAQAQDALVMQKYLGSMDMLEKVNAKFNLKEVYTNAVRDPLSKLYSFSTREDFLDIYRNHLNVVLDPQAGILTIGFYDVDKKRAQAITAFLIEASQKQVNDYNFRIAHKRLEMVAITLDEKKHELDEAIKKIESYQSLHNTMDPISDAQIGSSIIATLEGDIVKKQAEKDALSAYMNKDSFEVASIDNQIKAMQKQLEKERGLTSGNSGKKINKSVFEFERLKADMALKAEAYKAASVQSQISKLDTQNDSKTITVLTEPNLPDEYASPKRLLWALSAALMAYIISTTVGMVINIIRNHKN